MKKTLYFFAALISMMYGCTAVQTGAPISPWDNSHTPEWNIARNAIAMQDDDQWDFIKEIVKDKSIVVLGEQMHFDITSTTARIGLLRKLHECGFTTLVFEMAPMLSAGYRQATCLHLKICFLALLGLCIVNQSPQFWKCSIADISNFSAWIAIFHIQTFLLLNKF